MINRSGRSHEDATGTSLAGAFVSTATMHGQGLYEHEVVKSPVRRQRGVSAVAPIRQALELQAPTTLSGPTKDFNALSATTIGGHTCNGYTRMKYKDIGTMTWAACMKEAAAYGAVLCSEDYTAGGGWAAHLNGTDYADYEGSGWSTATFKSTSSTAKCVIGRDTQTTAVNQNLPSSATYNGLTWSYQDLGLYYYDECVRKASDAGATIIDPSTIGTGTGVGYWDFTSHSGNTYSHWTSKTTIAHENVGCERFRKHPRVKIITNSMHRHHAMFGQ